MQFDRSKVYTSLNADEVKIGSKGYFANVLAYLKTYVGSETNSLEAILTEDHQNRFYFDGRSYNLFYLVEEPAKEKYRPYENNSELREDFNYSQSIWVKLKGTKNTYLITAYEDIDGDSYVHIGKDIVSLDELFNNYCNLFDEPLGKDKNKEN